MQLCCVRQDLKNSKVCVTYLNLNYKKKIHFLKVAASVEPSNGKYTVKRERLNQ